MLLLSMLSPSSTSLSKLGRGWFLVTAEQLKDLCQIVTYIASGGTRTLGFFVAVFLCFRFFDVDHFYVFIEFRTLTELSSLLFLFNCFSFVFSFLTPLINNCMCLLSGTQRRPWRPKFLSKNKKEETRRSFCTWKGPSGSCSASSLSHLLVLHYKYLIRR